MKLKLLKLIRMFHLIDKEKYNEKRQIEIVKKSPLFNKKWYLAQNPDVKAKKMGAARHYVKYGWKEGRNPSPEFNNNEYLSDFPELIEKNWCPLFHYMLEHKELMLNTSFRKQIKVSKINNKYKLNFKRKLYMEISTFLGKLLYRNSIKRNKNTRILVCLHLFYMEAWPIIKRYLDNLSCYNYDLVVTYIEDFHNKHTLNKIKRYKENVNFYEYQNYGFDIGPFVDVLQKIDLEKYDIVLKIHSKGIGKAFRFVYNQVFKYDDWFYNLFDGVLGGINCHRAIKKLQEKNIYGLGARNLINIDPKHKQELTMQWAKKLGLNLKNNYKYIAGSMFYIKSSKLQDIKKLNLNITDFEKTKRGEFSFAHAMERIIFAVSETDKQKLQGLSVFYNKYILERNRLRKVSSLRILDDTRFEIDSDFFYKTLELRKIKKYKLEQVKIKDINRKWIDGNLYKLNECSPYLYLQGNKEAYNKYCKENEATSKFIMSEEKYNNLISSLDNGFNPKKVPVIHGENNILMDGQHRLCYLLNKYGEEYKVNCLHVYF